MDAQIIGMCLSVLLFAVAGVIVWSIPGKRKTPEWIERVLKEGEK